MKPRWVLRLLSLLLALLATACGPDPQLAAPFGREQSTSNNCDTVTATAPVQVLCARRSVHARQHPNATPAGARVPDATAILDWAERSYPQLFPSARGNQVLAPYVYRYYPETGNSAGVSGTGVWVLGPIAGSNSTPLYLGELRDFSCAVLPSSCATTAPPPDHCFRLSGGNYLATDVLIPEAGPFTVELWVFDSGSGTGFAEVLSQGAQPYPFYLGTSPSTREIRVGDGWLATGVALPSNKWVHVAVARSASGATTLYLDGREVASAASASYSGAASGEFRVGRQFGSSTEFFEGCIDELKVWRTARTPAQIVDDQRKSATSSPDLIAYYDFDSALEPARIWQAGRAEGHVLQSVERLADLVPAADFASLAKIVRGSRALSTCQDNRCGLYLIADVRDVPSNVRGISWYSSAWAFSAEPIGDFQVGLGSTWINPDLRSAVGTNPSLLSHFCANGPFDEATLKSYGDTRWVLSQAIEGSLGYWQSQKFRTAMPKYRPNATADCYRTEAGSPGWSFVTGQPLERTATAMVQLSNRLLIPPDGLTLRPGTHGELLGVGWMSLPWPAVAPSTPATGTQAWTLFMNAANFRGPVAYLLPQAWSAQSLADAALAGMGLDARSGYLGSMASEWGVLPMARAPALGGVEYARMPALSFPVDANGRTYFTRDARLWTREAFEVGFGEWASGQRMTLGSFLPAGGSPMKLSAPPRQFYQDGKVVQGLDAVVQVGVFENSDAWGLQWKGAGGANRSLPSYFKSVGGIVTMVGADEVPAATGLQAISFDEQRYRINAYTAPAPVDWWDSSNASRPGGWVRLVDGSVVRYGWYKFVDQPALQRLNLSAAERDQLQTLVTRLHRIAPGTEFIPPPSAGALVGFDDALVIVPPPGLEAGYVPVVISQSGRSRQIGAAPSGSR